jgi:N-acetylglucosamine repressor
LNLQSFLALSKKSIMQKATRQQTKEHNTNLVLKTIFDNESIGRAEISRITSLTRTTVSDIVAELITEGLVKEVGVGVSTGGKSPILLSLVADSRYLIGLDLARKKFSGAIVNLRGEIRYKVDHDIQGLDGEAALASVYAILDRLTHTSYKPLVGIGIGAPGLINTNDGVVVNAVNLDWKDLSLARPLQEKYNLPVLVFNDSQAAAMGEYTYGRDHSSEDNLIVINARNGIGAGIIIKRQLFQGDGGGAGEIGHVVVVPEGGLLCRCGNHGCLETVASAQALVKRMQTLVSQSSSAQPLQSPQEITLNTIQQAFMKADPIARQVVLESGQYMGMAISSLVGTLNIQRIVLMGDMTRFGQPWLEAIQRTISKATLSRLAQDTKVEIGQLGGNSIILGSSAMLANNYSLLFKSQTLRGLGNLQIYA